jgi:hypothetical protein
MLRATLAQANITVEKRKHKDSLLCFSYSLPLYGLFWEKARKARGTK